MTFHYRVRLKPCEVQPLLALATEKEKNAESKISHADLVSLAHACKVKRVILNSKAAHIMPCKGRTKRVEGQKDRQCLRTAMKRRSGANSTRIERKVKALGKHAMLRSWVRFGIRQQKVLLVNHCLMQKAQGDGPGKHRTGQQVKESKGEKTNQQNNQWRESEK